MARAMLLLVLLCGCALAAPSHRAVLPIEGAWRSHRELTLATLRDAKRWNERQWTLLSRPGFFGDMVQVHRNGAAVLVLNGECQFMEPLDIAESGPYHIALRRPNAKGGHDLRTLRFHGDRMYVPMQQQDPDLFETFERIAFESVVSEHPCVEEYLSDYTEWIGAREEILADARRAAEQIPPNPDLVGLWQLGNGYWLRVGRDGYAFLCMSILGEIHTFAGQAWDDSIVWDALGIYTAELRSGRLEVDNGESAFNLSPASSPMSPSCAAAAPRAEPPPESPTTPPASPGE